MPVRAAGEKSGPRFCDVIGYAGPVVWMLKGMCTELRDPGDAETVSSQQIVQVVERCIDEAAVGMKLVGDE